MKSYNNLWDNFISEENILLAIKTSSKGKKNRKEVKEICDNPQNYISEIKEYASNFKNFSHKPQTIYDGISRKKRTIIVPKYKEQIVHHMAVNILKPIFMKGMYEHSNGSIPNRGAHRGRLTIKRWIKSDTYNTQYCLKMDIKKYFNNIPHDIILSKLRKLIKDDKFYNFLTELISVMEEVSEYTLKQKELHPNEDIIVIEKGKGLPLGYFTSQWLANWYLQDLDHYIKENLRAKYYSRYMDDMVIFGNNKYELHEMRKKIAEYLEKHLGLKLKDNWQVFKFSYIDDNGNDKGRFLDFMGFRFYRNRIVLRRNIMLKATRKARKIGKKEKPTIYDCKQMMSYVGWLKYTDSYNMYAKWIYPYVSIKQCKRRVSKYDRRENKRIKNDLEKSTIISNGET